MTSSRLARSLEASQTARNARTAPRRVYRCRPRSGALWGLVRPLLARLRPVGFIRRLRCVSGLLAPFHGLLRQHQARGRGLGQRVGRHKIDASLQRALRQRLPGWRP